jgi:hypothetical protein
MSALRRTTLIQGPPGPPGVIEGTPASWTPGSVAAGGFAKTVVTVTGAVVGLPVVCAYSVALPDGCWLWAQVTAPSTVAVYLINSTLSPVTPTPGNIYVEVFTS